ncbi:MAG: S24 family peptidase [Sphingomonadaceae bacterium]|jgi:phage repressor protein C with HTH and peptisase S24 domain
METGTAQARLVELAEDRKVSLAALSRMIGKNASYLQQFVKKGSPRKLDEEDRGKLARFFAVSEDELRSAEEISYVSSGGRSADWIDVPRLALGASAGPGHLAEDESAIGAFRFSTRWLREQGLDGTMLSAIAVTGDSMEPTLRDGDEILVDRSPRPAMSGIHVVRIEDSLLVKRIDMSRPGIVALISDNQAYRPMELPQGEVEIVGKVVWKSGRL